MKRWIAVGAALATHVVLGHTVATAGELFVRQITLPSVARDRGFVLEARVVSVAATKRKTTLRARIISVWALPGKSPGLKPTAPVELPIYTGVEWNDPHKSPIDHRVWNRLAVASLRPKQRVVIVPVQGHGADYTGYRYEVTAGGPKARRKLRVFFRNAGRKAYRRTATARLLRDLGDADLFDLAYTELRRRRALNARAIFRIPRKRLYGVLSRHLASLKGPALRRFLRGARPSVTHRPALLVMLLGQLRWSIKPVILPALAPLANMLDPRKKRQKRVLDDLTSSLLPQLAKPGARSHAPLYTPLMLKWTKHRPRYASAARPLSKFMALLRGKQRLAFIRRLLAIATTTTRVSRGDGYDFAILRVVTDEVVKHPVPAHVQQLARLDPDKPTYRNAKARVFGYMMRMAAAIGKNHPQTVPRLKRIILEHTEYEQQVDTNTVRAWRHIERGPRS